MFHSQVVDQIQNTRMIEMVYYVTYCIIDINYYTD